MTDLQANAFDFGIHVVELAGWLKEIGKEFPLIDRLLVTRAAGVNGQAVKERTPAR